MTKEIQAKNGKTARRRGPKERIGRAGRSVDELAARVGANLRRLRIAAGMTQHELSQKIGWRQSTIGMIEASTSGCGMQTQTITDLAAALGVPLDELVADKQAG